jgi:hypothetical protein
MSGESPRFATFTMYEGMFLHVKLGPTPTAEDYREFLEGLKRVLDSGTPFTFFADASEVEKVPMAVGMETVSFLREYRGRVEQNMRASAIYVTGRFVTELLRWIFMMQPPVSPNVVVNDESEGMAFLESYTPTVIPSTVARVNE